MSFQRELRRHVAPETKTHDASDKRSYTRLLLERVQYLERRRKHSTPATSSAVEAGKTLTWTSFQASCQGAQVLAIKPVFHAFTAVCHDIVGDIADALGEANYVIFRAMIHPENKHRQQSLETQFGPIKPDVYKKLGILTADLKTWLLRECPNSALANLALKKLKSKQQQQQQQQQPQQGNNNNGKSGGGVFGADLEFFASSDSKDQNTGKNNNNNNRDLFDVIISADIKTSSSNNNNSKSASELKASGPPVVYDWDWLVMSCEQFTTFNIQGLAEVSEYDMGTSTLAVLKSHAKADAIQMTLFDLFPLDNPASFDFVSTLIAHRPALRKITERDIQKSINRKNISAQQRKQEERFIGLAEANQNEVGLVGITIKTEAEKQWQKKHNRESRRFGKRSRTPPKQRQEIDQERQDRQANADYGWSTSTTAEFIAQALPSGTTRTVHEDAKHGHKYEEVVIPPQLPDALNPADLVAISEFDDFAQLAFKGIKSLNRIQSKCFQAAYKSNENLLICAPTGAGKTNVAMSTIVREIGLHVEDGRLKDANFKMVYVAPMKALAQEVVTKFSKRLAPLGIRVKELTGDAQLSKAEIKKTHLIVTTPEKWDVITRKSGDGSLKSSVRLLIIDEIHLLHEDRGPVIEILVARTLRHVESSQQMCRIVGLSATLPNYKDVAVFLGVNVKTGLKYFDARYRPVPLMQTYTGVDEKNKMKEKLAMNEITYDKVQAAVQAGHQVMVFVHSRNETLKTAEFLWTKAKEHGQTTLFGWEEKGGALYNQATKMVKRCQSPALRSLFDAGFGIHHAGLTRKDRDISASLFEKGALAVICCTATLAWGVNLPAHTVIIKGTEIYNSKKGGFVDVGMLDVMQIFGRAGRPQYDTSGDATIITTKKKLPEYLRLLANALPIESKFTDALPDHLNAEVILGTVSNMREAVSWLSYTYLFTRMMRNPMLYGITYKLLASDPLLVSFREQLIQDAAKVLVDAKLLKYDTASTNFFSTDAGRVASHFYIHHESMRQYHLQLKTGMSDKAIFHMLAKSKEFENIKVRDEELSELEKLRNNSCPVELTEAVETQVGKSNVLLQSYISNAYMRGATLQSDSYYIQQSAGRISRALFELVLKQGKIELATKLLTICKMVDKRLWDFKHPLRQFSKLPEAILRKLEASSISVDSLLEMSVGEVRDAIRHQKLGRQVLDECNMIPYMELEVNVRPVTRAVLSVELTLSPAFDWNDRVHGNVESFWVWVEDPFNDYLYHREYFLLHKDKAQQDHKLSFSVPILQPMPPQYYVRCVSDRWLHSASVIPISFDHLILPEKYPPHTTLLDLQPLPVSAIHNKAAESMYPYTHFNLIQTQVFHSVYHTDTNIFLGAPTGSGKTAVAELAILRLLSRYPNRKVVYVAPMKALARERLAGWSKKESFGGIFGLSVLELTGDNTPDARALQNSNIIITTPEKFDGVSRNWATRDYVRHIGLVIIDEIHLLGQDRGPILEVIVSRMRYISAHGNNGNGNVRIVGLSTALSNAHDVADWLGIEGPGMFNFHPSFRPVPLKVYIEGYAGKHYCPRMATMNKPTYAAITTHSPTKSVLVFVSSRRQTRLTGFDLVSFLVADQRPRRWVHFDREDELQMCVDLMKDPDARHLLNFGIGLHHAGLPPSDRRLVEKLYLERKIQVIICTSTLAWGVNLPAFLVVIKGTEYYDGKTHRYVDFPITDVLQMMGRAGRPQYDTEGKAVVLVEESKKFFYLNFLNNPFPIESSLVDQLEEHVNAEVVTTRIKSEADAMDYLSWTFLFRRLLANPNYYGVQDTTAQGVLTFMSELIKTTLSNLENNGCLVRTEGDSKEQQFRPTFLGKIASTYYLKCTSVALFDKRITQNSSLHELLTVLSHASEFAELPVRHNEDKLNETMAARLKWPVATTYDSPFTKTEILFQARFSHLPMPVSDYKTDLRSVLDQSMRVIQSMIDISADAGYLATTLKLMTLVQMITQARWHDDSVLTVLPGITEQLAYRLTQKAQITRPSDLRRILISSKHKKQHHTTNNNNNNNHGNNNKRVKAVNSILNFSTQKMDKLLTVLRYYPDAKLSVNNTAALQQIVQRGETTKAVVEVNLQLFGDTRKLPRVHGIKPRRPGYWLVVGRDKCDELLLLKRTMPRRNGVVRLTVDLSELGAGVHELTLHAVSDTLQGIDRTVKFTVNIT